MPREYIPIMIYALFVLIFAAGTLIFAQLFGSEAPGDPGKFLPDDITSDNWNPHSFLLRMLFVFFGGQMALLFLWARLYRVWLDGHLAFALCSLFVFAGILFVDYIWILRKGALHWE